MKQQPLTFHLHTPGTAEHTADYILKILLEANREKLEQALRETGWESMSQGDREA